MPYEDSSYMQQTAALKPTILVADDDPVILEAISESLNPQYKILIASTGAEAVQRSEEYSGEIHLLVTDYAMKEMTGVELATRVSPQRPHMKILVMSGFPRGMLGLKEGWLFLAKPFIETELQTLITALIDPTFKFTPAT